MVALGTLAFLADATFLLLAAQTLLAQPSVGTAFDVAAWIDPLLRDIPGTSALRRTALGIALLRVSLLARGALLLVTTLRLPLQGLLAQRILTQVGLLSRSALLVVATLCLLLHRLLLVGLPARLELLALRILLHVSLLSHRALLLVATLCLLLHRLLTLRLLSFLRLRTLRILS